MTTDKVIERVTKLRAITVERGATADEAAAARALADRIAARFGLGGPREPAPRAPVARRPQVAHYAASAGTDRRSARGLRFVAFG